MYLQRRPSAPLAPYVEKLWACDGYETPHRRERVLPGARFQLIIDTASPYGFAVVQGMRTSHIILETARARSVLGVVFRPGGARSFFAPPAGEFFGRAVPLDDLWGSASGRLRSRVWEAPGPLERLDILDAELRQRLHLGRSSHSAVRDALDTLGRDPRLPAIEGVARHTGLSRRHLASLFREEVGLTPKRFCRLQRFQQVVRSIGSGAPIQWEQVSLEGGYYDQAHMAHEFREFSGVSPGAWLASERPFLNHAVVD